MFLHSMALMEVKDVFSFFLMLTFFLIPCCMAASQSPGYAPDRVALLTFKSLLQPDTAGGSPLSSWNNSIPYCQWPRVQCQDTQNPDRVTKLDLNSMALAGPISPSIANLTFLRFLDLRRNNFYGSIPSDIGNLSQLNLFDVARNSLTGNIPAELGNLSQLQVLSLGINNLTGLIPPQIYNLSLLNVFHVGQNNLSGTLPPDLGLSLPNLRVLLMHTNRFEGPIPPTITSATNLLDLELCDNNLTGTVPPDLGALSMLQKLDIGGNRLVSREAKDLSFLSSLANCTNLKYLSLRQNQLGGVLPDSISNLSAHLELLSLYANNFSGTVPEDIGNLVNLTDLRLGNNQLTGSVPDSIGNLQKLQVLILSNNKLNSEIPSSISNLRLLNALSLSSNDLTGSIPSSLGNCSKLLQLDLSNNRLSGPIPKEIVGLSSIAILLNLSQNSLDGALPSEVGSLQNLQALDISNNRISGGIPSSLGDCVLLEYLYMQGNAFQGEIPSTFAKLKGVLTMDLSSNDLLGPIPAFLGSLSSLRSLNISFNQFEGSVPNGGVFGNSSGISLLGNNGLCGGIQSLNLQQCSFGSSEKKFSTLVLAVIIAIVVTTCVILILWFIMRRYLGAKRSKKSTAMPSMDKYEKFSYTQLHKATNGFSSDNLIGEGGFGSVYKGVVDDNKGVVAIKVLRLQQQGASKSFLQECEVLRNTRHFNLVKIITSCSSVDHDGNDFKALVFVYMPNGSLDMWLHHERPSGSFRFGKLNLAQRLNIAIDVASAMEYLHHHGQTPIVHCDLKPSNVLLDYEMNGHVGDFGLAKLDKPAIGNTTLTVGIKGSVGYIPPEYGMGAQVSTQGDVYSYGILLLELFTGKRPTDDLLENCLSLRKFVEIAFPGEIMSIVDPYLLSQEEGKGGGNCNATVKIQECFRSVIRIGLLCSKESPGERMEMKQVCREMHIIREAFLSN